MDGLTNNLKEILGAVYRQDLTALENFEIGDVNMKDQDGRTPLMHAILAEDADPAIVQMLINRGADIEACDSEQKWTALHFAARDQKESIIRSLLESGATVDPVDVFGNTPLWRSVMNSTSNLAAVKELVKYGADPHRKNEYDVAPIDIARDTERADIVALFEGETCGH
jgi:ankyrin repeat protein